MNMRGFGFGSLALALGIFGGCGGDDGGGGGSTGGEDSSTGAMMTTASMTTAAMTTMSMDDGVDDGMMTTTGMDGSSTGEPPADSTGSEGGSSEEGGSSSSGGGGGGLNCDAPADDCQTCTCDSCEAQLDACDMDPGCVAIRDCAAENMCTGLDCLGPCGDVINMNGGVAGDSAMAAAAVGACVEGMCAKACA